MKMSPAFWFSIAAFIDCLVGPLTNSVAFSVAGVGIAIVALVAHLESKQETT